MKNTSVIQWVVGLAMTTLLGLSYSSMNTNASQDNVLRDHEGDIASISAKIERIPIIEGKLDTMLESRNIDPRQVEKLIEQRLELLSTASTTE